MRMWESKGYLMRKCDPLKMSLQSKLLIGMVVMPILLLLVVVWWPYNPLTIKSARVINSPVIAGRPVYMEIKFVKHANKSTTIITQLINERNILYSPVYSNLPPGADTKIISISTSTGDMPGTYYVRRTYTYTYFGFWQVQVVAESQKFKIIEGCNKNGMRGVKYE